MVSHAVSHRLIATTVNYKLDTASANRFHNLITKIASATIFLVQVLHHVSLRTCTWCYLLLELQSGKIRCTALSNGD